MMPEVFTTIAALRRWCQERRAAGARVALVPTMGALHDGHLELMRQGMARADAVVASIFVNPAQFGPTEDFGAYPRTWDADLAKLAALGVHAVFCPLIGEMYPPGFATTVSVVGLTNDLEGAIRPGHFAGVATVVAKLLLQAQPDVALFGEKDYQQLLVVRRLAADLDLPMDIAGVPIVRDADGLALSSRNAYLSATQLAVARQLNKVLVDLATRAATEPLPALETEGIAALRAAGFDTVDYLTFRNAQTLGPPDASAAAPRLLAAVRLGGTRLLDNMPARAKLQR